MKKYLSFTGMLLFCIMTMTAQIRSNRDIIGKWQGGDMRLEFFSNSKVSMTIPGGRLPIATYSANFMNNPIPVTITLTDNGQKMIYKVLLEFTDNETIKLQYFGEGVSTDAFEKGRTITLKKSRP